MRGLSRTAQRRRRDTARPGSQASAAATLAADLRDKARAKDKDGVEAAVKEFGAKACGTCHTPFRMPPPK